MPKCFKNNQRIAFVLFFSIFFSSFVHPQDLTKAEFISLTTADGLSDGAILSIFEDPKGYIWFGTYNGANKYNGYEVTNYLSDNKDTSSLSSGRVISILEDRVGRLWFGTNSGLSLYNYDHDNFIRVGLIDQNDNIITPKKSNILIDKQNFLWIVSDTLLYQVLLPERNTLVKNLKITRLFTSKDVFGQHGAGFEYLALDSTNNVWVISSKSFFSLLNRKDNSFETFKIPFPDNNIFNSTSDKFMVYDHYNNSLVISTSNYGLIVYSISTKSFVFFNANNTKGIYNNLYLPFIASRDTFWLPSDGKGLIVFDYKNKACQSVMQDDNNPLSLNTNSVSRILKDENGNVWVGSSNNSGVNLYSPYRNKFKKYFKNTKSKNTLSNNLVMGFYQDRDDNLWICMDGGGLNKLDLKTNTYTCYNSKTNAFINDKTLSVTGDKSGNLWIASWDGGISKFNPVTKEVYNYLEHCPTSEIQLYNWPFQVFNDSEDHLWVAFLKGGLGYYDKKKNRIYSYMYSETDKNSFISNYVAYVYEDSKKNIWVCTYNGLAYFNLQETDFSVNPPIIKFNYVLPNETKNSISSTGISTIVEDKNGYYWIGTNDNNGIDRFDFKNNSFKNYSVNNGLPGNKIGDLVCDKNNVLWVFTDKGLASFNLNDSTITNFDIKDGLMGNAFTGKTYMNEKGEIFKGAINGFNSFNPYIMKFNPNKPKTQLTGFKVYNKNVIPGEKIGKKIILQKHISELNEIEITYKENIITISYVAIDFNMPEKIQYKYMMEGFDRDWINAGNKREATYMNLDPGSYIFKVKASNNDGVWNDIPTELKIVVLPPWWQTWWFRALGLFFILMIIVTIFWYLLERARLKHQLNIERLEAEKLHEIDFMKLRFFTNVSHEFRTPLTLILGPADSLKKALNIYKDRNMFDQAEIILKNARRLLRLINQLLDFRKLEAGSLKLETTYGEISRFINEIALSFTSHAKQRNIQYDIIFPDNQICAYFDPDKLDKILYNLLSNAFKYSADGSNIILSVKEVCLPENEISEQYLEIKVSDTGIGIPQDQIPHLFTRYFRIEGTNRKVGTGIGLALTKELIELHRGTISVESQEGKGSCFTVLFPLSLVSSDVDQKTDNDKQIKEYWEEQIEITDDQKTIDNDVFYKDANKPLILLVEDNLEIRTFIKNELGRNYIVAEAIDGNDGLEKANELIPDIIVSDIMMPRLNGIRLTRILKNDERTSHIPIVLLTARGEEKDKIEGLETGADDYITKPFSIDYLKSRIENLIKNRIKLRELFSKGKELNTSIVVKNYADEKFMIKTLGIIESNLSNPNFGVEEFLKTIGMSRMNLYRKITSLTGLSAIEFIKNIRLKHAARLIEEGKLTVTEIAFSVGFNDPRYFTRCFKQHFGITPTEYSNKQKIG